MQVTAPWKLLPAVLLLGMLAGCPRPARPPGAPPPTAAPGTAPHAGAPYDVVAGDSLLTILVYRGGALASVGHNHVIACHALRGTFYLPDSPFATSFEVHVPVDSFTVDERALREQLASPDFPPDVPDSARDGTRHNMLGEALLDAAHYPEIVLEARAIEGPAGLSRSSAQNATAYVRATVRGAAHELTVPVSYQLQDGVLTVDGDLPLRQSELGLTPFSAMLGALQVQDEMRVRFHIVARAAHVETAH
jgi:hypothetical protein